MPALRQLSWFAAALLGAPLAVAPAAPLPQPLQVEAAREALLVTLSCPALARPPALAVAVDGAPVAPLGVEALGQAPPAVALVIDLSAPMAAPGTPHTSALSDAVHLARLLLELAPPGSAVALATAGAEAELVLPLTTDRATVDAALAGLAPAPPAPAGAPGALAAAVELATAQLGAAGPAPLALVVLGAEDSAPAPYSGPPYPAARALVVGHGAAAQGVDLERFAGQLGAAYAPYGGADIAALPAMHRALEAHLRALLTPGERLRLRLPAVGPGPHLLAVEGCGAPLAAAFAGPAPAAHLVALGLVVAALGAGLAAGRLGAAGRGPRPRAAAAPADTQARLLAAAAITTARRSAGALGPAGLRAIVWDGRRRWALALEGRHWTVGSDPGCTIVVAGDGVAPLHARLSVAGEGLTITDLESGGGTRIGALGGALEPGAPTPLPEGELVLVGRAVRLMVERAVPLLDEVP